MSTLKINFFSSTSHLVTRWRFSGVLCPFYILRDYIGKLRSIIKLSINPWRKSKGDKKLLGPINAASITTFEIGPYCTTCWDTEKIGKNTDKFNGYFYDNYYSKKKG